MSARQNSNWHHRSRSRSGKPRKRIRKSILDQLERREMPGSALPIPLHHLSSAIAFCEASETPPEECFRFDGGNSSADVSATYWQPTIDMVAADYTSKVDRNHQDATESDGPLADSTLPQDEPTQPASHLQAKTSVGQSGGAPKGGGGASSGSTSTSSASTDSTSGSPDLSTQNPATSLGAPIGPDASGNSPVAISKTNSSFAGNAAPLAAASTSTAAPSTSNSTTANSATQSSQVENFYAIDTGGHAVAVEAQLPATPGRVTWEIRSESGGLLDSTTSLEVDGHHTAVFVNQDGFAADEAYDIRAYAEGGQELIRTVDASLDPADRVDTDADGITDVAETNDAGSTANNPSVASFPTSANGARIRLETEGNFSNVRYEGDRSATAPYGLFSYEVSTVDPGQIIRVDVVLPEGATPQKYYKQHPETGNLTEFVFDGTTGTQIDGNRITLLLQDGGRGDEDGFANGHIVDPGGPGGDVVTIAEGPIAAVDWQSSQSGGTDIGFGTVSVDPWKITLHEGDSLVTEARYNFVVPQEPQSLEINFDAQFDESASHKIRDAVEFALLDAGGNPILPTHAADRDSFFNLTEGLAVGLGTGTTFGDDVVRTDITMLQPGDTVTFVARLVNNDEDHATTLTLGNAVAPVAVDDAYMVDEDTSLDCSTAEGLLANDTAGSDPLIVAGLVDAPSHGQLTLNSDGSFSYVPDANFFGTDMFTYRASTGVGPSEIASVTVTVNAVNDAPVGGDQSFSVAEDTPLQIEAPGLMLGSSDVEGSSLSVVLTTSVASGSLDIQPDGSFLYQPQQDFNGTDSFTFQLSDGELLSPVYTASITVTAVNDLPIAIDDSYSTAEDTPLTISPPGLLANDKDADNDPLVPTVTIAPEHGTATLQADGSFEYIPFENYNGADHFWYVVNDGTIDSVSAEVVIDITPVNDPPVGKDATFDVNEDTLLDVPPAAGLLLGATDIDSTALNVKLKIEPQHGDLTLVADGSFQFDPDADFFGTDQFTFQIDDGTDLSPTYTATIHVLPQNDPPTVQDASFDLDEDVALTVDAPGLLTSATDIENDTLQLSITDLPQHGQLTYDASGGFQYTPDSDYFGPDLFTFQVFDGTDWSNLATATLNVASVNDAPVAVEDLYATTTGMLLSIPEAMGVLSNDSDKESSALKAELVTTTDHGALTLADDGSFSYTPNANFTGIDSFVYRAQDADGAYSGSTEVQIQVGPAAFAVPGSPDQLYAVQLSIDSVNVDASYHNELGMYLVTDSQGNVGGLTPDENNGYALAALTDPSRQVLFAQPTDNADLIGQTYQVIVPGGSQLAFYLAQNSTTQEVIDRQTNSLAGAHAFFSFSEANPDVDSTNGNEFEHFRVSSLPDNVVQYEVEDFDGGGDRDYNDLAFTVSTQLVAVSGGVKFYVADNGTDRTYLYTADGTWVGQPQMSAANSDVRGITSLSDGSARWTIDASGDVFVYDEAGAEQGQWTVSGVTSPEGIATDGTDLWIIDDATDEVLYFAGAAALGSTAFLNGSHSPTNTFSLDSANTSPKGIASDGNKLWIVDDAADKVFVYSAGDGSYIGSWSLDSANADASGITLDADPNSTSLWIVDNVDHQVYHYASATTVTSGSLSAADTFDLGMGNFSPQGIADPGTAPYVQSQTFSIVHDHAIGSNWDNDDDVYRLYAWDPDGNPITLSISTPPAHGTVSLSGNDYVYTPAYHFAGQDSFWYTANDGTLESSAKITINVVNTAPVGQSRTYSINHDTSIGSNWDRGDDYDALYAFDANYDAVTVSISTQPAHGSVSLSGRDFTYTPAYHFSGQDTFQYVVSDGVSTSAPYTITMNVTNGVPSGAGQTVSVTHDHTLDTYADNDDDWIALYGSDPNGDPLTYSIAQQPAHGTASLNGREYVYQPAAGYVGTDSFTYQVSDGISTSPEYTISITVFNSPPTGVGQTVSVAHDRILDTYADNDDDWIALYGSDPNGDSLTYFIAQQPAHGSASLNGREYVYQPAPGYLGTDSFTYQISDGVSTSAAYTINITVYNDIPVGNDQSVSVTKNRTLDTFVDNDDDWNAITGFDPNGDPLTYFIAQQPSHGSVALDGREYIYQPDPDYIGPDSFTYQISDGVSVSIPNTIYITVTNTPPYAGNDSFSGNWFYWASNYPAQASPFTLFGNDGDFDNDPFSVTILTQPTHGTVTLNEQNLYVYEPEAGYTGTDSFTYNLSDGFDISNTATVTINVTTPIAMGNDDSFSVNQGEPLVVAGPGVLANDIGYGGSLGLSLIEDAEHGTLSLASDGSFTYTPQPGFLGTDRFTYRPVAGTTLGSLAEVTIDVIPDPPVIGDGNFESIDGAAILGDLAALVQHQSTLPLSYDIVSQPQNGTVQQQADGTFSYLPNSGFYGIDQFTFTVTDGYSVSNPATVTLSAVHQPTAGYDTYETDADTTLTVDAASGVLANDQDGDGDALSVTLVGDPTYGTVTLQADGGFSYVPATGFSGVDSFLYVVSDGRFDSQPIPVFVEVGTQAQLEGIEANPAAMTLVAGQTVLVSGKTIGTAVPTSIQVNGTEVESVDAQGNFFTRVAVNAGVNHYTFTASLGSTTVETTVTIVGENSAREIDINNLVEVDGSIQADYGQTSWDDARDRLWTTLSLENLGTYDLGGPLLVAVKNLSSSQVRVHAPDGVTKEGWAYFDLTDYLDGGVLAPGESSLARAIAFDDPAGTPFTYELVLLGMLNRDPYFTSPPVVTGRIGQQYAYQVATDDADGDTVSLSLSAGPAGMVLDPATNQLTWDSPVEGTHLMRLVASDGRGGEAEQVFQLTVGSVAVNSPPLITSSAVVTAVVGEDYAYPVVAIDPDLDPLSYEAVSGPTGLHFSDAELQWTPTATDLGTHDVTIRVDDGNGGQATQSFQIRVSLPANNRAPQFVSTPGTQFQMTGTASDPFGPVAPDAIRVDLPLGAQSQQSVSIQLPELDQQLGTADILFVVDESTSMEGEHAWLRQIVTQLDNTLNQRGIENNRYGLIGFGSSYTEFQEESDVRFFTVGNGLFGNAAEFQTAAEGLVTHGMTEDGYDAIERALAQYPLRENAARHIILITDEDRDPYDPAANFSNTLAQLIGSDIELTTVADVQVGTTEDPALGLAVSADGTLIVEDASQPEGYRYESGGQVTGGSGSYGDYANLTTAVNGWSWDLLKLREGGAVADIFGQAFALQTAQAIIDQVGIQLVPSDPDAPVEVLTSPYPSTDPGATYTFDVSLTGDGQGHVFDLQVVQSKGGNVLGSIPVILSADYLYDSLAVDPDGDEVTYRLVSGPEGALFDPQTGDLRWLPPAPGTYLFELEASDPWGASTRQTFEVIVTDGSGNQAPQLVTSALPPAQIGVPYEQVLEATDPDGDPVMFSLAGVDNPTGMSLNGATGRLAWTPPANAPSSVTVQLVLSDGHGGITPASLTLDVIAPAANQSPHFVSTPSQTELNVGDQFTYVPVATDSDGDPLRFDLPLPAPGMTIDPLTGRLDYVPVRSDGQSVDVVVRVTDGRGGYDLQQFTLDINAPNAAPVFISGQPNGRYSGSSDYFFYADVVDPEGDPVTFSLSDQYPTYPELELVDPQRGIVRWRPNLATDYNEHSIGVVATDDRGGVAVQEWSFITLLDPAINYPPEVAAYPSEMTAGVDLPFYFASPVSDPNGDELTYTIVDAPVGLVVDPLTGAITYTPSVDDLGTHHVQIDAASDGFDPVTIEFDLNVDENYQNYPPQISGSPGTDTFVESVYRAKFTAADPENQPIVWQLVDAPEGAVISSNTGQFVWTPTTDQSGTHTVTVRASDLAGNWDELTWDVNVHSANQGPNFATSPPVRRFIPGELYQYASSAVDPEGSPLRYELVGGPQGIVIDPVSGLVRWIPGSSQLGEQTVTIAAIDPLGARTEQTFSILVSDVAANHGPQINSIPSLVTDALLPYQYAVNASDPDGDSLTVTFDELPTGAIANGNNIDWTPSLGQVGSQHVRLHVEDPYGSIAYQEFDIVVRPPNQAPSLVGDGPAVETVEAGHTFSRDIWATDPDGDHLTYTLVSGPDGMTVDEVGRIRFDGTEETIGTYNVAVDVSDGRGASDTESFQLNVVADTTPPALTLTVPSTSVNIGETVQVILHSQETVAPNSVQLTANGQPISIRADGTAEIPADSLGLISLEFQATDPAGNVGSVTQDVIVVDPTDTDGPLVQIVSPEVGTTLTQTIDATGTISDAEGLLSYEIRLYSKNEDHWFTLRQEVGTAEQPLDNIVTASLVQIDTTNLANGEYQLVVSAVDTGGNIASDEASFFIDADLKIGNLSIAVTDLTVPFLNQPLPIVRTYDSLGTGTSTTDSPTSLGPGWSLSVGEAKVEVFNGGGRLSLFDDDSPLRVGDRVTFTHLDGRVESWIFNPTRDERLSYPVIFYPHFDPEPGTTSQLVVDNEPLLFVDGEFQTYNGYGSYSYSLTDPRTSPNMKVITRTGDTYEIGRDLTATKYISSNGQSVTLGRDKLVASNGAEVSFERDSAGRLTGIVDPYGNAIHYSYDNQGRLASFTDRTGNSEYYRYYGTGFLLEGVYDADGNRLTKYDYDSQDGRLVGIFDAEGNFITTSSDPDGRTETVTDAYGNQTTTRYDLGGNPIEFTAADGGVTTRSFDANHNVLSETDPLGRTTTFTYNSSNLLTSQTDALGNTSRWTYYSDGTPQSAIDPLGNATRTIVSRVENPKPFVGTLKDGPSYIETVTTIDPVGDTVTQVHNYQVGFNYEEYQATMANGYNMKVVQDEVFNDDEQGNYVTLATRLSTYDQEGTLISVVAKNQFGETMSETSFGQSTTYQRDAEGRVTEVVTPTGTTQTEYDALGREVATIDVFGRRTENVYDLAGKLIEKILPDDTPADNTDNLRTSYTYDLADRLESETDEHGLTTSYVYDAAGRVLQTIQPDLTPDDDTDNPRTTNEYDLAGQLTATIDSFGNRTEYTYDQAGRQIQVVGPTGLVSRTVYDAAGRVIASTEPTLPGDPVPGSTSTFDAAGRVIHSDYYSNLTLDLGTDAQGFATTMLADPDPANLLRSNSSTYEHGQLTSSTNSLTGTTTYEYDSFGRRIATVGNPVTAESVGLSQYAGMMVRYRSETVYDSYSRVETSRENIIQVVDSEGNVTIDDSQAQETSYQYDEFDQPIRTTYANGSFDIVRYDQFGRVVAETSQIAAGVEAVWSETDQSFIDNTTTDPIETKLYEYDAYGRLVAVELPAVADPNNGGALTRPRYEYEYDAHGNKTVIRDPLGRETRFTYDERGQMLTRTLPLGYGADGIEGTPDDTDLPEGDFTERFEYDQNGRETLHVSFEGTVTRSTYDEATGRLIQKDFFADETQYTDGAGTPAEIWTYQYDAFGRELEVLQDTDGNLNTTPDQRVTQNTYDSLGRLHVVANSEGTLVYDYDALGRQTSITVFAAQADITTATPERVTSYTYDALGRLGTVTEDQAPASSSDTPLATSYRYDLRGNLDQTQLPNGVIEDYIYDDLDRLESLTHYAPDATPDDLSDNDKLAEFDYTVRADGQRTSSTETYWLDQDQDGTPEAHVTQIDWTYDALGRLTEESIDHFDDQFDQTEWFTYDLVGNRTKKELDNNFDGTIDEAIAYMYDANDRLQTEERDADNNGTVDQTTTYGYDHTQQTSKTVFDNSASQTTSQTSFTYDLQGRLNVATVTTFTAGTASRIEQTTYDYDADGIRISALSQIDTDAKGTWDETTKTEYLVDHHNFTGYQQVIKETEYDVNGNVLKVISYNFGQDEISQTVTEYDSSGQVTAQHTEFFGHDGHGSVKVLYDASAAILQIYTYEAYGQMLAIHNAVAGVVTAGALTNLQYSGEQFDSRIGQQYLRARYYDPNTGRFNRLDPFAGNMNDPQSLHKYLYAHGNPVMGSDPSGLLISLQGELGIRGRLAKLGLGAVVRAASAATRGAAYLGFQISFRTFLALGISGGALAPGFIRPLALQQLRAEHEELQKFRRTLEEFRNGDKDLLEDIEDEVMPSATARRLGLIEPWEDNGRQIPVLIERISRLGRVAIIDFEAMYDHGQPALLHFHNSDDWDRKFRRWAQASWRKTNPNYGLGAKGETLEEYPFASTIEGGIDGVHVDLALKYLNSRQGKLIQTFKRNHPEVLNPLQPFLVVVVP
ncbi:tandem-95 repeat protein [bacterium]|nr:tandem-95 repeat protein [bacterium]